MCACSPHVSMRRGAPSSPRAPSRGKMVSGALQLETKLCEALEGGDDAMVESLLRQGADPNRVLSGGIAAIHLAAGVEQVRGIHCLARILHYGGDPNIRSIDGLTPLHVAASWDHDTRLRLLLMEGGNPWLEDQEGNTALDLARKHGNEACVQMLCGVLAEMEEEPSSWMSQRRAESFLSTVTEDTWEAGGASEFYGPSPVLFERTPEREMVHPLGPQSCFFPSVAAASERGGTSENGLDKPASLEDWPLSSFLTECSWQDVTRHEPGGLPPHLAPPSDPLVSSMGKQASEGSVGNAVQGTKLPARRVKEASVETRHSRSVENSIDEQGGLSPDPSGVPLRTTLRHSESCPPGANPEIPSAPGSQEIPKFPLACTEDPECKTDSERRDADATLNLTQYSGFLDPDLVVKLGHQEGLDVTSPDHVYLFSRANPVPVSDLEKTLVAPAFQPGREQGGCSEEGEPCGRGSDGGGLSLYTSCHSECHVSATDTSSYNQAHKSGEQKVSFACLPDCSGIPLIGLLCHGLCCEAAASVPLWVSLDESEDAGPLQRDTCDREAFSGPNTEKESLDSRSQGRISKEVPSPLSQYKALTWSASQKERNWDLNTRPFQEPEDRTAPQAESEDLPEGPPLPRGEGVAAEKPRGEDGRRTVPGGWTALGEEEKGEAESGSVSMSTQIVLEKTLWAQDTGLIQRPSGDTNASPSCGATILPRPSEDTGPTMPILDQPASDAGEEPSSLEAKLRAMMLATKIRHSPLVQSNGGPRHVTLQTATSAMPDSSGSSSLFEETLEMPRRPPRVRSPEAKAPSTGQAPHGAAVLNTTDPPGKEMGERKNVPFVSASPNSPRPGSGPSGLLLASPALLTDAGRSSCFQPEANADVGCFGDSDLKSPAEEKELSPLSREEGCTSLERVAAASSWTDPEWPVVQGSKAKRPPRPSRVSFSRLSAGGLPCLPGVSAGWPSRQSPVVQAVPLSPGGRPIHVSTAKPVEYLYVDNDQGHSLVERHIPCMDDSLADTTAGSEDTIVYDWRAYIGQAVRPTRQGSSPPRAASEHGRLSDEALVRKLRDLGVNPGPVTGLTRKLYVQLLEKLISDPKTKARKATSGYSSELSSALETYQIPDGKSDEMALAGQFDQPDKSKKWREGLLKSSFNYLLLDPRVTQNLPFRSQFLSQAECFRTFVSAIFYVGKGKRSRPYSHLYEALNHYKGKSQEKQVCSKVQHILEIWASAQGVVSMHCFQNVIPVEAYTREACMVDAIGLRMLTNQKKGNYYGVVAGWPMKRRRCLGVHLLHRAMQIFLAEGERQLRPADIRTGP